MIDSRTKCAVGLDVLSVAASLASSRRFVSSDVIALSSRGGGGEAPTPHRQGIRQGLSNRSYRMLGPEKCRKCSLVY